MNQRLIKHLMNNWNFNFDMVFNGAQALEALKKQHYDLILMDIQMPEMDGYTAAAFIRSEFKSSIPIIAMTAHAMAGEKEKCLKAGMDDYLSKPINEEMMYEMIGKYAARSQGSNLDASKYAMVEETNNIGGKVIDLNVIERYSKGNVEFRNELIQEFITTIPSAINSLESAIKESNYGRIREIAHDMKTSVHIMGLTILIGHILQKIEVFANSNSSLSSIYQLFTDVKSVCLQAVQEAGRLVA
jgi:CheY-like chemotaxis protein